MPNNDDDDDRLMCKLIRLIADT